MNLARWSSLSACSVLLAVACLVLVTRAAHASVGVTPATGGSAISADTTGGAYTALTGPVITEGAAGDIGNSGTFVLAAPSGFAFDTTPDAVTVTRTATAGTCAITVNGAASSTYTATASTVTITLGGTRSTSTSRCRLTVSGLRVRPTAGTPLASGNITSSTSGTATIVGISQGSTNLGTLTEVAGAFTRFIVTTPSVTAGTSFSTTLTARDQFGNLVMSYTGTPTITWTTTATASPSGSAPVVPSAGPVGPFFFGFRSVSGFTLYRAGETPTITATSSLGQTGTSAPITVEAATDDDPDALRITADTSTPTVGSDVQLTITAVDRYGNTDVGYSGFTALVFSGLANSPSGNRPTVTNVVGTATNLGSSTYLMFESGVAGTNVEGQAVLVPKKAEAATLGVAAGSVTSSASGGAGLVLTVQPKALAVTGLSATNRVYDGTTSAAISGTGTLVGVIPGDAVSLAGTPAGTFASKTVGAGKTVAIGGLSLAGAAASNYTLTPPTATASITAKNLTVTGVTARDKVYDGTTSAALDIDGAALVGVVAGDVVTLNATSTSTFADEDVGMARPVTVSGLTLGGADGANYTLTQPAGLAANVTPRNLTVSGVVAADKTYDRTTVAAVDFGGATLIGVVSGDDVELVTSSGTAAFASRTAGEAKTVTVGGLALAGADAANYSLTLPSLTATIAPRPVTPGVTAAGRPYDGTDRVAITARTLSGVLGGDDVTLDAGSFASLPDKRAGAGRTATTGLTLAGADAADYVLTSMSASATVDIAPKTLTVTGITAANKVYDAATTAALALGSAALEGVVDGDDVALSSASASGTFADRYVGTSKLVTIAGLALTGADAENYVLAQPSTAADITPRPVTPSVAIASRPYDATTGAAITGRYLAGVLGGDDVALTGGAAAFADRHAGEVKVATATGFGLAGSDAPNYALTSTAASASAAVTPRRLTATGITASDRLYDATTAVTISTAGASLAGVLSGDSVALDVSGATAAVATKTVGAGKAVTVAGLVLAGPARANYTVTQPAGVTASVTARPLTVSGISAVTKAYDGSAAATLEVGGAALVGVVEGDTVTLDTSAAAGTFASRTVGTGKPVSVTGLAIGGADAGNYTLAQPSTTAGITARPLTVTGATVSGKVYDGGTSAPLDASRAALVGVVAGDAVTLSTASASAAFADRTAGSGKAVTIGGMALAGADAGNYTLAQPVAAADIAPRPVAASVTIADRVYDATTAASIAARSLAGVVAGDDVALSGGTAAFADKSAGSGKTATVTGLTLVGVDAANYVLTSSSTPGSTIATASTSATASANVTPRALAITGVTANNKLYDGTVVASISVANASLVGVVPGDRVAVDGSSAAGALASKHAGAARSVTVSGLALSGADAANYTLAQPSSLAADIAPKPLTLSGVIGADKIYDGNTTAAVDLAAAALTGIVEGDWVGLVTAGASATFVDDRVETAKPVRVTGLALSGADAANYTLVPPAPTADITPRALVPGVTVFDKVYDGTTRATVAGSSLAGTVQGDIVLLLIASAEFDTPDVGTRKQVLVSGLAVGGPDGANYVLTSTTVTATADITLSAPSPAEARAAFVAPPVFGSGYLAQAVFTGGTVDELERAVVEAGARGVWVQDRTGAFALLIVGAPAFVNDVFRTRFPVGLPRMTATTLVR